MANHDAGCSDYGVGAIPSAEFVEGGGNLECDVCAIYVAAGVWRAVLRIHAAGNAVLCGRTCADERIGRSGGKRGNEWGFHVPNRFPANGVPCRADTVSAVRPELQSIHLFAILK